MSTVAATATASDSPQGRAVEQLVALALRGPGPWWWAAFLPASALTLLFFGAIGVLFTRGVGIWGLNVPVVWAFDITSYVWWIAIAMSGTFISAALHLTRQEWGVAVSRYAEAMTVFALAIAGMFPIIHLGRPWFFYWLAPYPNPMALWPQWRSPLVWDFFAILAYLLLSLMFFYLGLLPDLAALRDRARAPAARLAYGLLALGWRGDARQWWQRACAHRLLAGLAVPLVVSVHSVVGLDFATGNTPGWHSTIFPPFFVAGAMFSGFAMALTIGVLLRRLAPVAVLITVEHLERLARLVLAMGLVLAYCYAVEIFMAWRSGDRYEIYTMVNRLRGPYAPVYWTLLACVVVLPQLLWWPAARRNETLLLVLSLVINVGMWLERFMLIVTSTHRDFLPSAWGMFYPTAWDWAILAGSLGFFAWLFLLFVRLLPVVPLAELRATAPGGTAVLAAARAARAAGTPITAHTPHLVPGLAEALGVARNRLPRYALLGGLLGGLATLALQAYSLGWGYPLDVGDRSPAWPALVPACFEMTILGAALAVFIGMLVDSGLPRLRHQAFDQPRFARVSRDRYLLLAVLPLVAGCEPAVRNMYDQPRYDTMAPAALWADGASLRPLVPGVVAAAAGVLAVSASGRAGTLPAPEAVIALAPLDADGRPRIAAGGAAGAARGRRPAPPPDPTPPRTLAGLERGRTLYEIHCAPCHGLTGDGDGMVVQRGFPRPAPLGSERLRRAPDAWLAGVIGQGYGVMAAFGDRLTADQGQDLVGYLRALQLSQHATGRLLPPAERARLAGGAAAGPGGAP